MALSSLLRYFILRYFIALFKYPEILSEFALHGKIHAYKHFLARVLENLSNLPDEKITYYLSESCQKNIPVLPPSLKLFEKIPDLYPLVILYYICRTYKPEIVIETGVWTGKSTWFILRALSDNSYGKLYSIDLGVRKVDNQILPTKEIGGFVPPSLRNRWSLLIGDSKEVLPKLVKQLPRIDLFFHDSLHTYEHMLFEFCTIWPFLRKGGILCSDDVLLNNAWHDFMNMIKCSSKIIGNRIGICYK